MRRVSSRKLASHRRQTFRSTRTLRLRSAGQAAAFVEERGFVYFWPIQGVDLPSLWTAVAGDRPVADEHDDPGHVTWGWKDDALGKRVWYYGKVLRRKATIIALETVPYFYALSPNYGNPAEDYLLAYEAGTLTSAARRVYEALLGAGPLNTIDLRRAAKLQNARDSEFSRALEALQADFRILPVGVAEAGAWHYSHVYDLVARHFPDLPEQAREIADSSARRQLVRLYLSSIGAARAHDVRRLFAWGIPETNSALQSLIENGLLVVAHHSSLPGDWFSLPDLCD